MYQLNSGLKDVAAVMLSNLESIKYIIMISCHAHTQLKYMYNLIKAGKYSPKCSQDETHAYCTCS